MASLEAQFDFKASGESMADRELLLQRSRPFSLALRGYRVGQVVQISHLPPTDQLVRKGLSRLLDPYHKILDPSRTVTKWVSAIDEASMEKGARSDNTLLQGLVACHQCAHWGTSLEEKLSVPDITQPRDEDGKYPMTESMSCSPCTERCFLVASNDSTILDSVLLVHDKVMLL